MDRVSRLKGGGYLASTVSVVLLAVPAFKSALESPPMLASLLAGMGLSIGGMGLRWRSHRIESRRNKAAREEVRRQVRLA
jgi:hypothetical protein